MGKRLTISAAEAATILAALRYWQMSTPQDDALAEIATNNGAEAALDHVGIDTLCQRVNVAGGMLDVHANDLEGWGIFNGGEIQRDDERDSFESDDEAIAYVRERAAGGSKRHLDAITQHDKVCKDE